MKQSIQKLIQDLPSSDFNQANSAIVRTALLLEWDAQGHLDRSTSEGFPQDGLYDSRPTSLEVMSLITGLKSRLSDPSFNRELHPTVIWALTESACTEALDVMLDYLNEAEEFKAVCEASNILASIAEFFAEGERSHLQLKNLKLLQERLRDVSFLESNVQFARNQIMKLARTT